MVWMRMENPDQTQPKQFRRYFGLEIFIRRDQVTVVPGRVLACVLGDENLRNMTLLPIIAAQQEARSFFGIRFFAVRVDLGQNFWIDNQRYTPSHNDLSLKYL